METKMSEPSHEALKRLKRMLIERQGFSIPKGSVKFDGKDFWVLASPELIISLIERAEDAEDRALAAEPVVRAYRDLAVGGSLPHKVFDFLNGQDPEALRDIIRGIEEKDR